MHPAGLLAAAWQNMRQLLSSANALNLVSAQSCREKLSSGETFSCQSYDQNYQGLPRCILYGPRVFIAVVRVHTYTTELFNLQVAVSSGYNMLTWFLLCISGALWTISLWIHSYDSVVRDQRRSEIVYHTDCVRVAHIIFSFHWNK